MHHAGLMHEHIKPGYQLPSPPPPFFFFLGGGGGGGGGGIKSVDSS